MKKSPILVAALSLAALSAFAGPKSQSGTVLSQTSVGCGGKKSMCQQYVVRSGGTDYTVRQEKAVNQDLIALNTPVEFMLKKSEMKLKANGKSYKYVVIGQAPAPSDTAATSAAKPQ